ncbi:hypothetical protein SAMN05421678_106101 [Actinopolymorpha cephalotaxi]|uniref:F5/8 type C domain-containing protein n=1 Tax=Actinopolymorpha cephalotaxi TaxID=504797 RepID=A0A1I2S5G1_9ACTN|nr:hypothetical protein [Actinopolymorpha cephalotaxi]NYH87116.1 hypothetical protein [Actinopolymorpha cephalotaxi]SFG47563.1 hypothetical protein SAMN05421678_106101 [Actinopolymorpha cephalotaxi]
MGAGSQSAENAGADVISTDTTGAGVSGADIISTDIASTDAASTDAASTDIASTDAASTGIISTDITGPAGATVDNVTLTVRPTSLRVMASPCGGKTLDVGIHNSASVDVYADVLFLPAAPLTVVPNVVSSYLPAGYTLHAPVRVGAPLGSAAGNLSVVVRSGRTAGTGPTVTVPVTLTTPPTGAGANIAPRARASASSTHSGFTPCGALDGNTNSDDWQVATGWNDATSGVFPDWFNATFSQSYLVSRVVVRTLNSTRYPASRYGLRDWDVQVPSGTTWRTVASVRGNTAGVVTSRFTQVRTTAIRIAVRDSNDHKYSRIIEVEIYA